MSMTTFWRQIRRRRQFGNIVSGVFTPVLAKHSKSFSLIDCISVGVDRMQRNFEPMRSASSTTTVRSSSPFCRPAEPIEAGLSGSAPAVSIESSH